MSQPLKPSDEGDDTEEAFSLPVEVEIFIQPDGSVVFADLEAGMLPIIKKLDPPEDEKHDDV